MIKRRAAARWKGENNEGTGTLTTPSAVLSATPYSVESRFRTSDGTAGTNPEELLAAAHAGCYAMSLGQALQQRGWNAVRVDVDATVSLAEMEGGVEIQHINLTVEATVPGMGEEDFVETAEAAKTLCPMSLALHSVPITLVATIRD